MLQYVLSGLFGDPICIYMGWVTLATALNFASWLKAVFDTPPFFSAEFWAIVALASLTSI